MIDPLLIPIAGIAVPIVLVPIVQGLRYARYERQLEHAERIKALEMGRTLPKDEPWWTLPRIGITISTGVPATVFFCAWQASSELGHDHEIVWLAAGIVGFAAVVCGSALAALHFLRRNPAAEAANDPYAKARFDADAYDVVSSRG